MFAFDNMIVQYSSRVLEADRFDADVGVESVLVEENRTACEVGHVKPFTKNIVINIVRRLLQGNDVPLHRNLFFNSIFCASSGPRVPVVNTKPPLQRRLRSEEFVDSCRTSR